MRKKIRSVLANVTYIAIVSFFVVFMIVALTWSGYHVRATKNHLEDSRFGEFLGEKIKNIATIPTNLEAEITKKNSVTAKEQRFDGITGFTKSFYDSNQLDGYLLLARYSLSRSGHIVELYDLEKKKKIHVWDPNFKKIAKKVSLKTPHFEKSKDLTEEQARVGHPLPLKNGNILFNTFSSPLFKMTPCGNLSVFNQDVYFHHSLEKDRQGNIWSPARIKNSSLPGVSNKKHVSKSFNDDSIVKLNPQGDIIFEKSIIEILVDNNLGVYIWGFGKTSFQDPVHLNDIEPVDSTTKYWKKGDLFLSSRHNSLVFLYRPSTNKVVWYSVGPWKHQHDVDIVNDRNISVFDNNLYRGGGTNFVPKKEGNNVPIYNFTTQKVSYEFEKVIDQNDVRTPAEGRSEIIGDNIVLIEETNYGRILALHRQKGVLWEYVNREQNGENVYYLNWSRYLSEEEGRQFVKKIKQSNCQE